MNSTPGRGTTIHLYLPAVAAQPQAAAQAGAGEPMPGHGEHGLYVDDDEAN